jgi:hypothetical protein
VTTHAKANLELGFIVFPQIWIVDFSEVKKIK